MGSQGDNFIGPGIVGGVSSGVILLKLVISLLQSYYIKWDETLGITLVWGITF